MKLLSTILFIQLIIFFSSINMIQMIFDTQLEYLNILDYTRSNFSSLDFFPKDQIRLVFISKVNQNNDFLFNNKLKFTHLSPNWFTFNLKKNQRKSNSNHYFSYITEYLYETENNLFYEDVIEINKKKSDLNFIQNAKKFNPNLKIVPVIRLSNLTEKDIFTILTDELFCKKMVSQFIQLCQENNLDGLVFDVWSSLPIISKEENQKIFQEISKEMRKNKLMVFIKVPSSINNSGNIGSFIKNDIEILAPYVNGIILNTFEYSSHERPGPIQPLKWIENCIKYLVPRQKSPIRKKILVGITLHGNVFGPMTMKSLGGKEYLKLLKLHKPKIIWNENWNEHYFDFKEMNVINRVFYPTLASLKQRFELIKKLNCGLSFQFIEKGLPIFNNLLSEITIN